MIAMVDLVHNQQFGVQKDENGEVSKFNFYCRTIYKNLKFNFLQNGYLHNLVLYLIRTVRSCSLWVYMPFSKHLANFVLCKPS